MKKNDAGNLKNILQQGADVDFIDSDGNFGLKLAATSDKYYHVATLLLQRGANVSQVDRENRSALIVACSNGSTKLASLLLGKIKQGPQIDWQDDKGYTALMTACQNGHAQITSHLLDEHADTFLKNNEGMTAFDIMMKKNDPEMLHQFTKLRSNPSYPRILFSDGIKRETITTAKKKIDLEEAGITLSIPENALSSTDPPLHLAIQPCFSGPFEVPQNVELVSPAYIVKPSRKVSFRKEVLVKIWHHANLESEKDCEDMVFLSASITPEYRGDSPVYVFREVRGAKGVFKSREEQPAGKIALKHFCTLATGKRKHEEEDTGSKSKFSFNIYMASSMDFLAENLYSARLYKATEKKFVFCICLFQPKYILVRIATLLKTMLILF